MKREQAGERKRKRAWWLGAVLGVLSAAFFFCTFPCFEPFYASLFPDLWSQRDPTVSRFDPPPQPFDQANWQRGYATDRMAMGKWLVESRSIIGLKRDALVAQLGAFDYESEHEGKKQLIWLLGDLNDDGFTRHVKLLVKIDKSGTVVDAHTYLTD